MCNLSDLIEERGIEKGRAEERRNTEMERERGWKSIIALCREVGMSREQTIQQLMDKCELNSETAESLLPLTKEQ